MFDALINMIPPTALHQSDYRKGEAVFWQDDPTRGIFCVESGQINLQRAMQSGHVVTMHQATAGTLLAEASLYSDRYLCDAACIEPASVICIEKQEFTRRLAQEPDLSLAYGKLLATQVQTYRQTLEILSIKSARDRTLVAVSCGYLSGPVTEFASRIGLTHEACYRALRQLCDAGMLIQTGRGKYALPDPA